ncbi:filamin A-interacting protein 1-like [Ostrea edulis]|uniref:filamin A-interacting protein 1-like n=1 Tax=Ostrea edulis TaxID=37623 RepID=UPI0024AEEC7C|nr:filamin A-interacting protein 1-like [Ostrea edulis]
MKQLVCLWFVVFCLFGSNGLSVVTDNSMHNSTDIDFSTLDTKSVDVFRQLLNQETLIRMTLVKNVHVLMKDMVSLQQSLVSAESEISSLKDTTGREITELKKELQSLKFQNNKLNGEITKCNENIFSLKENITEMDENHRVFEKQLSDEKRKFERNTSGVLADLKIEVRYLSTTLLDLNKHTLQIDKNIPELVENKYMMISERVNDSMAMYSREMRSTGRKLTTALSDLERVQQSMAKSLFDDLNSTVSSLEAEVKKAEYEQLKLSSTLSSLEVFRMNVTNNHCGLSSKVSFTATITSSSSSWSGGTLVFPKVINNVGGGYNTGTGIFTAPVGGHYVFFVSVQSYGSGDIRVDIVLNGSSQVRTMAYDRGGNEYYETGVNLVVLRLDKGDTVWVKHYLGKGYYTDSVPITTFSGFQL